MPMPDALTFPRFLPPMAIEEVAKQLVQCGKGIIAADESATTIGKRLAKYGVENTEELRRDYRELFATSSGLADHISGMILNKETLFQDTASGTPLVEALQSHGLLPGVKVDEGLAPLEGCSGESHTNGIDGLQPKCERFARQGARFTKWRAALAIGSGQPSARAISVNADELARYAAISQAAGLVPIVEPEILIDGDYDLAASEAAAARVLDAVFAALRDQGVNLRACLLKIQMVMPGSEAPAATTQQIAAATLRILARCVPSEIPGVVFLSGGQSEEEATVNLDGINKAAAAAGQTSHALSFSFGRSLQASVLQIWSGDRSSAEARARAQAMAVALAAANAAATRGAYAGPHPSMKTESHLREANRGWR